MSYRLVHLHDQSVIRPIKLEDRIINLHQGFSYRLPADESRIGKNGNLGMREISVSQSECDVDYLREIRMHCRLAITGKGYRIYRYTF